MTLAVFTGSFDPVTYGHLDIISRGLTAFDELIVAVGNNQSKNGLFTPEQRIELIKKALAQVIPPAAQSRVSCALVSGLVAEFAKQVQAAAIIRGVRSFGEFEAESNMAALNRQLGGVETVILPSSPQFSAISSSAVKEIAAYGGDITAFVPPVVADAVVAALVAAGSTQ
jgi:pantetheine-phosphate adenylyltransferase